MDILEELIVTTLVTRNGDTLDILLYGCIYDLLGRSVMPEMYNLCSRSLHDPAHDINGGVMPIK